MLAKGSRLIGKQNQSWRCKDCNSKCAMLSTMLGGWPIDDYKNLPEDKRVAFWNSTTADTTSLKKAVEQQLVLTRVKSRWHELVGEFQPLSWYTARGYDTSTFSVDAPAEWNDDMGCMTYKIGIHKTGDRSQEEIARTDMLAILQRVKKKAHGDSARR